MTHLSDFSFLRMSANIYIYIYIDKLKKNSHYLERAIGLSYLLIWLLYRIATTGGFECLYFQKFKRGELKSIVTATILVMLPFQLYYGVA
jgi:hypothetical protein